MDKSRILVVEDDPKIARTLRKGLEQEGFAVTLAPDGEEGYFLGSTAAPDLIVLDLMLPGRDGIQVLEALRGQGVDAPILILSARDGVDDRIRGLRQGADDYLVKPFSFGELVARIEALLRRRGPEPAGTLRLGDLVMDRVGRRVTRGDRPIELTNREYTLLEFMLLRAGTVISRETLAREVWRENGRATPIDNIIDVYVSRLRKRIQPPPESALIHTVRGVGFVLREEEP